MYVYQQFEPGLWTVGSYDSGKWEPESDHDSEQKAASRVRFLNGGTMPQASNEQLVIAMIAGMLMAAGKETSDLAAVTVAREILDTVYKTEEE